MDAYAFRTRTSMTPRTTSSLMGVIDVRVRNAYASMVSGLKEIATQLLKRPIPVVVHGYDYPVPDGRGFLGGFGFLPGPWLQPGFQRKGFDDVDTNTATVGKLIDRFNEMLRQLSRSDGFDHVRYVDLRDTLSHGAGYKRDWANELHPTKSGFSAVAGKIANVIQ